MRFQFIFGASFLAIALGVFQSAAGEPSAPTNTSSTSTNANDDFDTLVKRGDQARLKRDYLTAIKAYRDAIRLREDTLVEGRLGLLLFEARAFDVAAQHLQHAIERPSKSVSDTEYTKFSNAFRAAQKEVCRLDIVIDHLGARFEVEGDLIEEGKGEFWFFVTPGKHKLRVSLDGFEDEIQEIDTSKGEQMSVKFTMRPIAKTAPETENLSPPETKPPPKKNAPIVVPEDKPAAETNAKAKGSLVVGGGLAFVFAATPQPAVGPQAFVAWRSPSWWEIGVDARVGWTLVDDERFSGAKFVAWSVGVAPCGRVRDLFFGCGLIQVDGVGLANDSRLSVLPGLGLRAGVDLPVSKRVRMQIWADATAHPGGFAFPPDWLGFFITGSVGARGTVTF